MRPDPLNRLRLAPEQTCIWCGSHVLVANRYGLVKGEPVKPVSGNATTPCSVKLTVIRPVPGPEGEDRLVRAFALAQERCGRR